MNKILRIIKLTLPAQNVKMGGELGAMLGQYNLNIMKFCKEFNDLSIKFEKNFPIKTELMVLEGNTFQIKLKGPSSSFLIKHFLNKNNIHILDIYKISCILSSFNDISSKKSICKNIISSLKSSNKLIKYE